MPKAKPPGRGRKSATAVAVQAPEAKPPPVQIGPSKDALGTAGPNRAGRRCTAPPRAPPRNEDGSPRHPPRREPTPVRHRRRRTDHDRPPRLRPPLGKRFHRGRPARTARRAKDGTRERAPLGQAAHRIGPALCHQPRRGRPPGRINVTGHRHCGAPPRGGARRPSLDGEGTKRREAIIGKGASSGCPPFGPPGSAGRDQRLWDVSARGGRARVDHRLRASLRRLMMSAFGPPPAPLRSVLADGQPNSAGVRRIAECRLVTHVRARRLDQAVALTNMLERCARARHGHES